jgi:phenylacetate-coenzyme A ligase PaaK-like adenylate-forming protein
MSQSAIDQQLAETVAAAYAGAPAVKRRFDAAGLRPGDIDSVADLARLPVLTKDEAVALQAAEPPFGGMLGVPLAQVEHVFFSPGPLYEPAPNGDDPSWEAAVAALQLSGFYPEDVVLNSLSYHLTPAGYLFDTALVRLGCTVIPGGVGNSELQLTMMREFSVTGFVGTASFLMSLIQKAEELGQNFRRDYRLRQALVTAEPLPASLRQSLVEKYGLALTNAYGTAEFGLLALNPGDGLAMRLLPEPIIQVVNPDSGQPVGPGETGEVVVTNFSRIYPLIRFGTGDMAMNIDPRPGQSAQEERSIILVGRRGEAVKVRGMFLHPNQLRFAAGQVGGIERVQAVISRPRTRDRFELHVVARGGADQAAVAGQLGEAVQSICRVRVDDVRFVAPEELPDEAPPVVDERTWE